MAKKKSTEQQQSQTNNRPENPIPKMEPNNKPAANDDPTDKLSTLKSLNAMLLKETVEKRQEVGALLESKKSLESELSRSVSEVEALRAEFAQIQAANDVGMFTTENEELRREKEGLMKRLEDVEREMGEVVREKDEIEKAKFEGDLQIGSMKKLENELRSEIMIQREAMDRAIHENESLKHDLAAQVEERNKLKENIAEIESIGRELKEELRMLTSKYQLVVDALDKSENQIDSMRSDLASMVKNCDELERQIGELNEEKLLISRQNLELNQEKDGKSVRINELEKQVCQLNVIVLSLREDEEK